jgi:hypothetical protein
MTTDNKGRLKSLVSKFFDKIPSVRQHTEELELAQPELPSGPEPWPAWTRKKGVYYFLDENNCVLYVGKGSTRWGVVYRIKNNLRKCGADAHVRVGLILFDEENWYWSASLEEFLIDALKPPHNKVGKNV